MHKAHRACPYPLFHSTPHDLAITSCILELHRADVGLDLLHAHYALPHAVSAYLARSAACTDRAPAPRLVTTLHGTDITLVGNDPSYAPLTEFVVRASDAVTAVSEDLAARTRETLLAWSEGRTEAVASGEVAIDVIPNFVDLDHFHPGARRRADCGDGSEVETFEGPCIVHVSNFRPVKRVPWLVEAFGEAVQAGAPGRLVLVGDGPDQPPARALAQRLGIADRVRFLGTRDVLPELLAPATAFALSSREESFGLSALEAMASGTPVVATRVGGVGEVVRHGETGLLVDAEDTQGFAAALARLLREPELAATMGARRAAGRGDALRPPPRRRPLRGPVRPAAGGAHAVRLTGQSTPPDRVYLDHNAATPLRPEVRDAWADALERFPANPSSLHTLGSRGARHLLDEARERTAAALGVEEDEVVVHLRRHRVEQPGAHAACSPSAGRHGGRRHELGRALLGARTGPPSSAATRPPSRVDAGAGRRTGPARPGSRRRRAARCTKQRVTVVVVSIMTANNEVGAIA